MEHPTPSRILRLLGSLLFVLLGVLLICWIFHDRVQLPVSRLWIGRTHPLLVHFPVALLCILTLAWLFRKWIGENLFRDQTFKHLLLMSAFIAILTALSGYVLSVDSEYDEALLNRHRNLGSLTALLSVLMWMLYPLNTQTRNNTPDAVKLSPAGSLLFSVLNIGALGVLVLAGHYGGSLTHGEGYLLPETPGRATRARVVTDSSSVFEAAVLPVFERKCFSCHNEQKAKGGLVMETLAGLRKGGKNGAPWIPGDPVRSLIVERMLLAPGDKKHMPPKGKPQLDETEIALISYWIQRGANVHQHIGELASDDSLRQMAAQFIPAASVRGKTYDFPSADPATLRRLHGPYRNIVALYQGSPALSLSFFLGRQFSLSMLEECVPLSAQIVSINLAQIPVGDEIMPVLARFSRLEQLNLSGTEISGSNIALLSGLRQLETLSLSGTRVSAESMHALQALPNLHKVYLAQTGADSLALTSLRKMMPKVEWITGAPVDTRERLRLTPPQLSDPDKHIFTPAESVSLRHPMKGVKIRYTVDGSAPDSMLSPTYQSPLPVTEPMAIRAIAVKEGWLTSAEMRFQVFPSGIIPTQSILTSLPEPRYALQGAASLFDGQMGEPGNLLVNWMGFREQPMNLLVALEGDTEIDSVIVSTGINHGAYVFPPREIRVRAGMDSGRWDYSASLRPEQPKSYGPVQHTPFTLRLRPGRWKYVEITVHPVTVLPPWHGGKGQKGWAFIDEVFID